MKSKQLLSLVVVAIVLVCLAWWSSQRGKPAAGTVKMGDKVLVGLADRINDVGSIRIQAPSGTAVVTRVDGLWRVPGKYGYRADFTKISDALRKLADLKITQVMRLTPVQLEDLHLQAPGTAKSGETQATVVELKAAGGSTLASLRMGKDHNRPSPAGTPPEMGGGYPDGKYVALDDNRVYLVGDRLDELAATDRDWLDQDFLNVPAADLSTVDVSGGTNGAIHLARPAGGGEVTLPSIPAGKEVDSAKLSRLTGALGYLRFEDIADPALPATATGLDRPVLFKAVTTKGTVYTLKIGGTPTNDVRRYVGVAVAFEAPPAPAVSATDTNAAALAKTRAEENRKTEDEARALNEKLSPWTFLLGDYQSGAFLVPAAELLKDKPSTNTPPAAATAAPAATTP